MRNVILAALLTIWTTAVVAAEPTQREIDGTELIVRGELDDLEAPPGDVSYQPNENLAAAFPGYLFVLAQFGDATAEDLPSPLVARTLFAVSADGTVKRLATAEDVIDLFKSAFKPITSVDDAKQAAEAALALEQAKYPEQPFAAPTDLTATPDGQGGFQASGSSQPAPLPSGQPAGTGAILTSLGFNPMGLPASVSTTNNYKLPVRRLRAITSATIAADQALAQQAAGGPVVNVNVPAVNQALPGQTFYTSPSTSSGSTPGAPSVVVAVDSHGKPHVLSGSGAIWKYVRQQFGKLTTAQQAHNMMKAYLTLVTTKYPNSTFAPVQDSDITVTAAAGGWDLKGTVYVAGDKTKYFRTHCVISAKGGSHWTFNPHGV